MEFQWLELTDIRTSIVEPCLALYQQTFSVDVREPEDVLLRGVTLRQAMAPNGFHFLVALDEQQQVAGFSTAHYLADVRFGFVVYLLVNPAIHGQGLGGKLLAQMQKRLEQDAARYGTSLRGVILETEREEDAHNESERSDSRRRNRFFNRQGFGRLETVHYVQPPLWETTKEIPLHLYVRRLADQTMLTGAELRQIVQAMYEQKYGNVNHVDAQTLRHCEALLRVPNGVVDLLVDVDDEHD
jgi:GNAT superfamily N-acetyltransferase